MAQGKSFWKSFATYAFIGLMLLPMVTMFGGRNVVRLIGWPACPGGRLEVVAEKYVEAGESGTEYSYYCNEHGDRRPANGALVLFSFVFHAALLAFVLARGKDLAFRHVEDPGAAGVAARLYLWLFLGFAVSAFLVFLVGWLPHGGWIVLGLATVVLVFLRVRAPTFWQDYARDDDDDDLTPEQKERMEEAARELARLSEARRSGTMDDEEYARKRDAILNSLGMREKDE